MPSLWRTYWTWRDSNPRSLREAAFKPSNFIPLCLSYHRTFILQAGFEPTRSNANDIDRVLCVIPPLHQKKFSEVISFKGYSPTDFNQIPWRTYTPLQINPVLFTPYGKDFRSPLGCWSLCGHPGIWTLSSYCLQVSIIIAGSRRLPTEVENKCINEPSYLK